MTDDLPGFIVVEGPIGVGKTSLAKRLAEDFGSELLLEGPEENPFLGRFYQNPRQAALPTQLYFLMQRVRQMQELKQGDIFSPVRVADFLIDTEAELQKVSWSTRQEVAAHTVVVIMTVAALAVFLYFVDMVLLRHGLALIGILPGSDGASG